MTAAQRQDLLPAFREGRAVLDCEVACSWPWVTRRRMLYSLYVTQQWEALSAQVLEIGYQEDLAYFWLARAAEGQGYLRAAAKYYAIANRLTLFPDQIVHCNHWSDGCFGIDVRRSSFVSFNALKAFLSTGGPSLEPGPLQRIGPTVAVTLTPPAKVEPSPLPEDEVLVPPSRP